MRFIVVSGRSGSGKSSALHLLEDEGFTCIDNIPVALLPALIEQVHQENSPEKQKIAIGIDARNINSDLERLADTISNSHLSNDQYEIIFLDASKDVLLKRFSETRRRHPLSNESINLSEAIDKEKNILAPIVALADLTIDTSGLSLHQLRSAVKRLVVGKESQGVAIELTSFGFKYGMPIDVDFVFDVRCLPNPHWEPKLRTLTGKDQEVITFLQSEPEVNEMLEDILKFIKKWVPAFEANNRSYLTIGIGCTGGMHRSVYLCELIANNLKNDYKNVQVNHRQIV